MNNMVATDEEKVRKFKYGLGQIYIFERSQGKVKSQVDMNSFVMSQPSSYLQFL